MVLRFVNEIIEEQSISIDDNLKEKIEDAGELIEYNEYEVTLEMLL